MVSHGKRADSIVKNMLLHSREGPGERTRVNVNAMVEEARVGRGFDRAGIVHEVHHRPSARGNGAGSGTISALILIVDDEPDVADLFDQQFRASVGFLTWDGCENTAASA